MNTNTCRTRAPGPSGNRLLGCLSEFRRDALGLLLRVADEYGDVVRIRIGPVLVHLLNHPAHLEHVLVHNAQNYDKRTRSVAKIRATCGESLLTAEGDSWRRHRRLIQPAFRPEYLQRFVPEIASTTERHLQSWNGLASRGDEVDVVSETMQLTLKIAARMLFGADLHEVADVIERSLGVVLDDTWRRLESLFDPSVVSRVFHRAEFRHALNQIDRVVYRIIEQRRQAKSNSPDLLSMLLAAHQAENETGFSDKELRDAVITLLLAGHETTANALAWTFYLVSQSAEVEQRLCLEAESSDQEQSNSFTYASMVFAEAIRLYPSIWIIERRAIGEDQIAGYRIAAGSTILISPYLMHRHADFWDRPHAFDPSRFEAGLHDSRPRYSYCPFGAGPHQCIGQHMASLVSKHVLTSVYRRFRLRLVPGQKIDLLPQITLRHAHGLRMTLEANS